MAIQIFANGFKLDTRHTSYLMQINPAGYLLHTYYGGRISDDSAAHLHPSPFRNFNSYPDTPMGAKIIPDTLPMEYPTFGIGDYRVPGTIALHADGSRVCDLRYKSCNLMDGTVSLTGLPTPHTADGENAQTLEILLCDDPTGLQVILGYTVYAEKDVIVRYTRFVNAGKAALTLEKAASFTLDFPTDRFDFIRLYGAWAAERHIERTPVCHGLSGFTSRRGSSSHFYNPFFALCDHDATEHAGDVYGFHLMYSGNHSTEVEGSAFHATRCVMGIAQDGFAWRLEPGASFETPAALLTFSEDGLNGMSQNFHTFILQNICPKRWMTERRPILINNWEATYFDFNEEKLLAIAKTASALGIEMFVMDDGWFGHRTNDQSSLGDWFPDLSRLPDGIAHLVNAIRATGMKFGIWMEPEMISRDSKLFAAHPDWYIHIPGRTASLGRCQYVLDMSRKEVVDYLFDAISKILSCAEISYLKWDMNRNITDAFSVALPAHLQGEFLHRYILGVYNLMGRVTAAFPDLLLENCSGGGGRFDTGMLAFCPQIWTSDDTDPMERTKIQYGTSLAYPISTMGAHVSASPNHQTNRATDFSTRASVAFFGTFGYELDVNRLSEEERAIIRAQCDFYRAHYETINRGTLCRLVSPFENSNFCAWAVLSPDQKEILIFAARYRHQANREDLYVKLPFAPKETVYTDPVTNRKFHGDTLARAGLCLVFPEHDNATVILTLKA